MPPGWLPLAGAELRRRIAEPTDQQFFITAGFAILWEFPIFKN
jgi:hypothetical protein